MPEGRFSRLEKPQEPAPPSAPPGSIARGPGSARAAAAKKQQEDSSSAVEDNYSHFLSMADEFFFTGNFQEALRNYSRALQQDSAQVYPWIGQISALIGLKHYKEAELWSNRALEQFPEDSSLLSQRARVLALTGNLKRAIGVSDYAIQKGATQWSWLARGEVLLEAGDNNSLFCFEKAMEMAGKSDWRVPLIICDAYVRRRQWASAHDFLRRSIDANAKNYYIWFEYAKVLFEMNHTDRSRDAIARVLQLKPDFRAARDLEGKLYRRPLLKRIIGVFKR